MAKKKIADYRTTNPNDPKTSGGGKAASINSHYGGVPAVRVDPKRANELPGGQINYDHTLDREGAGRVNNSIDYLASIGAVDPKGYLGDAGSMRAATWDNFEVPNPMSPNERIPYRDLYSSFQDAKVRKLWKEKYPQQFKTDDDIRSWMDAQYRQQLQQRYAQARQNPNINVFK